MEITFRMQVARKGNVYERDNRLVSLLAELEVVPPYDDPLADLSTALGTEPPTLAGILDAGDALQAHANRVFGLAGRTEQVVK
jgi:hypothetical protein